MSITTHDELRQWLTGLKQGHHTDAFIAAGWLGDALLALTREDLADLGVPKDQRGDILLAVEALRQGESGMTLPDEHAPSYAPQFTNQVIDQCRALGRNPPQPWVDSVASAWPGPIAHEYHRLRELLTEGHIVPAIFQLKDLVEVLIKFPALVMARDLIQHGDTESGNVARRALFGGMLALGGWLAGVRDGLGPQVLRQAVGGKLLMPELGSVFAMRKTSDKIVPTPWCQTLADLVKWRNDQVGHGAFLLDPAEYLTELRAHLGAINAALATQRDLWNGVVLRGDGPHGPDLIGWRAIRHWHTDAAGAHQEQQAPVLLERGEHCLHLGPLVALRCCTVCGKQDVFQYDSLAGHSLDQGFKLLDYLTGHRLGLPPHRAGELLAEVGDPSTISAAVAEGELDEDYGEVALNELLETKLLEARYLRPEYLREPLRYFVEAHQRGVFWLTAPGHTGKSVFVHALATPAELGEKPLLAQTAVVALHIRREFKTWPEQLRYFLLEQVLRQAFGREPGRLRLPELDVRAENPAEAFAALLHEAMRLKPPHLERLVIGLDGLDELPPSPAGEAGIAEFIPRPEALPEGCFLLLTSRPLAECPPHVRAALAGRFDGQDQEFTAFVLTLDPPGTTTHTVGDAYRQLLRAYFDRELMNRLKTDLYQALAAFIAGRDLVECRNDLGQLRPPALAAFAKQEWAELTRAVQVSSPASAPSLVETVVQPLLVRFDAAFAAVLEKANERFLYLAHLTELLRDGQLRFEDIAALPSGAGLYRHYLTQLQRQFSVSARAETPQEFANKLWDFARRVIVTLAAIEQAHVAYQEMLPPSVREEVFRGVPLDILAALLDEPRRSVHLVFTLYTLKSILAVWKGEDSRDAHYALGLKDFAATVQALWSEALTDHHRFLADQMLGALEARWETVTDADRLDEWRLRYVLAHADLSGVPELAQRLNEEDAVYLCFYRLGERTHERARYAATVAHWSLYLTLLERRAERQGTDEARNDLAGAHMNRGNARRDGGDLAGALADYDRAIELMEGLRTRLEARGEWPPAWANDLAAAHMNRGITREQAGDLAEAIEDWVAAAMLYRQRVERGGLPAGVDLLKATFWVFGGYRDLADWPSAAQSLLAFMGFYQQLEAQWAEQYGDTEPSWQDIVGQFANTVHGLNSEQRAALLEALGENAEAVKQTFGWT